MNWKVKKYFHMKLIAFNDVSDNFDKISFMILGLQYLYSYGTYLLYPWEVDESLEPTPY